jgi:hypothetical protein
MASFKGTCGTADVVISDFNRRVHIWAEIDNTGLCPIKVRFFKSVTVKAMVGLGGAGALVPIPVTKHIRKYTKTVRPGHTASPDRDEVNRITISCAEAEDECDEDEDYAKPRCSFTYSIKAT